ncbi:domain-containing serine serine/threonine-protein kinase-like [Argonauta hians]
MAADLNRSSNPFCDYHQMPTKRINKSCEYIQPWKPNSSKMPTSSEVAVSTSRAEADCGPCAAPDAQQANLAAPDCHYHSCSSSNCSSESFENNQSFPKASYKHRLLLAAAPTHSASTTAIDPNAADYHRKLHTANTGSLNSFLPSAKDGLACFGVKCPEQKEPLESLQSTLNDISEDLSSSDVSVSKSVDVSHVGDCSLLPSTIRNPNKAIFTIDAKTSQILTANEMACALFGYNRSDMIGRCLTDLIQLKKKDQQTIMESYRQPSGQVISIAGKVVEAVDKDGLVLPVSLWMKRVDYNNKSRCLVAMEPIHRLISSVYFDPKGNIVRCDEKLSCFFGYSNNNDIHGTNITQLIPAFKLPKPSLRLTKSLKKQRATGKTLDGSIFPLTIHVHPIEMAEEEEDSFHIEFVDKSANIFEGVVCIFSTITGLITFFPDGTIHSINHHFALMLFGYSGIELIGKNISTVIPDFYSIVSANNNNLSMNPCSSSQLRCSVSETSTLSAKNKRKGSKRGTLEGNIAHHKHQEMLKENQFIERNANLDLCNWMKDVEKLQPESASTPYRPSKNLKFNPSVKNEELLFLPSAAKEVKKRNSGPSNNIFSAPEEVIIVSDDSQEVTEELEDSECLLTCACETSVPLEKQQGSEIACDNHLGDPHHQTSKDLKTHTIDLVKIPVEPGLFSTCSENIETDGRGSVDSPIVISDDDEEDYDEDSDLFVSSTVTKTHRSASMKTLVPQRNQSSSSELSMIESKMKLLQVDCEQMPSEFGSDNNLDCEHYQQGGDPCTECMSRSVDGKESQSKRSKPGKKASNAVLMNRMSVSVNDAIYKTMPPPSNCKLRRRRSFKALPPWKMCFERSKAERMLASSEDSDEDSFELLEREIQKSCLGKDYDEDLLDSGDILSPKKTGHVEPKSSDKVLIQQKPTLDTPFIPEEGVKAPGLDQLLRNGQPKSVNCDPPAAQRPCRSDTMEDIQESTEPVQENLSSLDEFTDGEFSCVCLHKDGSDIAINFVINPMLLETGELMFCMWVSQDLDNASVASVRPGFTSCSNDESLQSEDLSCSSHGGFGGSIKGTGDYGDNNYPQCKAYDASFQNLRTIGRGAFGFVVEATDKSANSSVIVKYILRSKVLDENWRDDAVHGRIPLEASMLTQLSHPNIVQVLDVFDSPEFILMVMEKHGSGMDLFEFIEHKPIMDEPLYSYIFRQIVYAVGYLHRAGIVHRDLKDENIIVNEQFHIKLIDFGSAAYIEPEKMFATFCGTVEYCSPEVLMGNWYEGPELEVWSMGVTLYTLVYGENPFYTVDDILECNFSPPYQISEYLTDLLYWMLLPEPGDRMTIEQLENDTWVFQPINIKDYTWAKVMHHEPSITTSDHNVSYEPPVSYADIFSLSCGPRISSVRPLNRNTPRPHHLSY